MKLVATPLTRTFLSVCSLLALALPRGWSASDETKNDSAWLDALLGVTPDLEAALAEDSEAAELAALMAELSGWQVDASVAAATGWQDNALRDAFARDGAFFTALEFDVFASRLGFRDAWSWGLLAYGDLRLYEGIENFDSERFALLRGSGSKLLSSGWRPTFAFELTSSEQAFNAGESDFEAEIVSVGLWLPRAEVSLERKFAKAGKFVASLRRGKYLYSEDGQDFDETVLGLSLERRLNDRWKIRTGWEGLLENYDDRLSRSVAGDDAEAPLLEKTGHSLFADFGFKSEEGILRRSNLLVRWGVLDDRWGDYYERDSWSISPSVTWDLGAWDLEARASYGVSDYAARPSDGLGARRDENLSGELELSRALGKSFDFFARLDLQEKKTNVAIYAYDAQSFLIGFSWKREAGE